MKRNQTSSRELGSGVVTARTHGLTRVSTMILHSERLEPHGRYRGGYFNFDESDNLFLQKMSSTRASWTRSGMSSLQQPGQCVFQHRLDAIPVSFCRLADERTDRNTGLLSHKPLLLLKQKSAETRRGSADKRLAKNGLNVQHMVILFYIRVRQRRHAAGHSEKHSCVSRNA